MKSTADLKVKAMDRILNDVLKNDAVNFVKSTNLVLKSLQAKS